LEKLQQLKTEAYDKMQRRVVFTDLSEMGFDEDSMFVPVQELHLDVVQQQINHDQKVDTVIRQEKVKGKKRKNKGLGAFMDDKGDDRGFSNYKAE
jgi:hypothetical protein